MFRFLVDLWYWRHVGFWVVDYNIFTGDGMWWCRCGGEVEMISCRVVRATCPSGKALARAWEPRARSLKAFHTRASRR